VSYYADYKIVTVKNPQPKKYCLVKNLSTATPADCEKVLVPLKTLAEASATHYEFLNLIGEIGKVTAVSNAQLAYNETIRNGFAAGKIIDLGDALSINVEKVLHLQPSVLMMSGYNNQDANAQRITQAGIPVILNNEWQEYTLLGRAEWLKFVAAFFDKEKMADSIFTEIVARYNSVKYKSLEEKHKPSVMSGSNYRGTWYMPAGGSFVGQLYADAGASYFYANDSTTGSLPQNIETVLKNFANADFWLACNYRNLQELRNDDAKNALFKAVKVQQVYSFNKRILPSGANDFWESAVARPDLLLSDVIAILHPNLLPDYELVYAIKLQ
jgi:iron complex transport system substrate-binding protein